MASMPDDYATSILFSIVDFGIIATDLGGNITAWNPAASALLGLTDADMGRRGDIFFTADDRRLAIWNTEMSKALELGKVRTYTQFITMGGSAFWAEGTVFPIRDSRAEHIGFVKIFLNRARRRQNERDLLAALQKDPLTGLANRSAFDARFSECTKENGKLRRALILHLIDLDHFKAVNDTLGHQAGDLLLTQVAAQIRRLTRETDFVARFGGDEFGILQIGTSDPVTGSALAEKIRECLSLPFDLCGSEAHITASIGIAVCPDDGEEASKLLRKADAALYRVKRSGRNGFGYFTNALDIEEHQRARDVKALRESLGDNRFRLVYQPKIALRSGRILGMEALLRCDHPTFASRPIVDVLDLAKACGEMTALSKWILHVACFQASNWFAQGHDPFKICVNFSARELSDPKILDLIDTALHRSKLIASLLDIELTEDEVFQSKEAGLAVLRELRMKGVAIALDDFGTGYSSLSYLTNLPVDVIKLDISFIRNVIKDAKVGHIVESIINLAHALDLIVVAEGVEKSDQLDFFRKSHCEAAQGYLICKPLPAEGMTKWMQAQAVR